MRLTWRETLRGIMQTAWTLFRKGLSNLSMSLKVAWKLHRGEIKMAAVEKQLRKR